VNWIQNFFLSHLVFIKPDNLAGCYYIWSRQDTCAHLNWPLLYLKIPIPDRLLIKKSFNHLLDSTDFFLRIDSCLSQRISHARTLSDTFFNTIYQAKLCWKKDFLVSNFSKEHWLVRKLNLQLISLKEVVGHSYYFSVFCLKSLLLWFSFEINIGDDVLAPISPISYNTFLGKLLFATCHPQVRI
jgi:hypothetical protein